MLTIVFPGQGSQDKGMGQGLFDAFPDLIAEADALLGYSIRELCLENPDDRLVQTQFTQPALFVVGALAWLARNGGQPDLLAGHSLGEYNALFAGGAFDFKTGLSLVQRRGALMARASGGGMAAVLGFPAESIAKVLTDIGADQVDIANDNSPSQVVISGPKEQVERALEPLEQAGARRTKLLEVSAAFHSRHMMAAAEEFRGFLAQAPFRLPNIPVLSNVTARPHRDADQIRELLVQQIIKPVRWTECMRYAMALGTEAVEELGPGKVLTGLFRQIKREATPLDLSAEHEPQVTPTAENPPSQAPAPPPVNGFDVQAHTLGSASFRATYGTRWAYVAGAMYKGIASKELVVRMGKAGLIGFLGTGGLEQSRLEADIDYIQRELRQGQAYGMNLLYNLEHPELELAQAELFLRKGVRFIEAAAYLSPTEALVWFRFKGAHLDAQGRSVIPNQVIAKVSRPEIARWFMSPPPEKVLEKLAQSGRLDARELAVARRNPISHDICLEADSGGHTDMGVAYALFPAMNRLRVELTREHSYEQPLRLGAAGGIGSPEAVAAAFVLGADFILTGSVNQCTVEAGTSDLVKDMLQTINIQDTDYAPAGDMFELGARVQVLKRGTFFPARANKLFELYRQYNALEEIDPATATMLQEKYFKRSFQQIWEETSAYWRSTRPAELEKAERNPKHKMALVFKWYFVHTNRLALAGEAAEKVSFQVHCGPALGAFNQFVAGTELASWRNRHVDEIARLLMEQGAAVLRERIAGFARA